MSDVKRYHVTEAGLVEGQALGRINVVLGADHDRVTAERDALQQRLTAADERASELLIMLRMAWVDTEVSADNCRRIDAALKPADGQRNQCDGCQAGIPVVNGAHRMGKPGGYPDTMSCTAKLYADDRPAGCCCPPRGHVGLWAGAMCPVHYGLRAIKPAEMLPADHKCIECDSEYCHGVCVERGDSDDRLIG